MNIEVAVTHPGSAIVIASGLPDGGWQGHLGREDDGRYRADLTESDVPAIDAVHRDSVGRAGPFDPDTEADAETLGYGAAACILAKLHGMTRFRLVIGYEYPREPHGVITYVNLNHH